MTLYAASALLSLLGLALIAAAIVDAARDYINQQKSNT